MQEARDDFLAAVAKGETRRELFLFERKLDRDQFKLGFCDAANIAGLCPLVLNGRILFDGSSSAAYLVVVYPEVSIRFAGIYWDGVHGLDALDKYPDYATADKARLLAFTRMQRT